VGFREELLGGVLCFSFHFTSTKNLFLDSNLLLTSIAGRSLFQIMPVCALGDKDLLLIKMLLKDSSKIYSEYFLLLSFTSKKIVLQFTVDG